MDNADYSTLEVAPNQHSDLKHSEWRPLGDEGKHVAPQHDKYYVDAPDGAESAPIPTTATSKEEYGPSKPHVGKLGKPIWFIIGALVLLVIILAAVLGGVLGSRHPSKSTDESTSPSSSSSTTSSDNSSSTTSYSALINRNLAAISFSAGSANSTKLYYQDGAGQIMEATVSLDNTTWSTTAIGVSARNGSALAAAVSSPGFTLAISVIYLDDDNLIHDYTYDSTTGAWSAGTLSSQGYIAISNSSLSVMYHQCTLCANTTIIAFQDKNGYVQIGESTTDGWNLTQLSSDLDPLIGTGLALQPFYRTDQENQINLYHQKANLSLALADRMPDTEDVSTAGTWVLDTQIYRGIASGSPIAAASSYSNVSTGYESWIEVLYLSDTGIEVNTWEGSINGWLQENSHPSPMTNSTSDSKVYNSVAVTADGIAFSVVTNDGGGGVIEQWQLANNFVDWTLIGSFDLSD